MERKEVLGLTGKEAKVRLAKFGLNELEKRSRIVWWKILLSQFKSPLIYVLLLAALVTFFMKEMVDTAVIMVAVVVNAVLGFVQEFKAEKSLEALSDLISSKAEVKRDGKWIKIDSKEVVVGDVVRLAIGRVVPADGVWVVEDGVFINEAILTGESAPVEKKEYRSDLKRRFTGIGLEYKAFMGTVVERGIGEMVVVKTAGKTKMGKIALGVRGVNGESTPLQKKLGVLSKQLAIFVGIVTLAVLIIGLAVGDEFSQIFPTAVALAVAAIPEGLVVSLTVILAIGMRRILKRKALVRKLLAAETLGGVDVICADKTGTITEGKMTAAGVVTSIDDPLSKQLGGIKYQNKRVIKILIEAMVLCNDMRDPLEVAMESWALSHINKFGGKAKLSEYERLDELPFDLQYKYIVTRHRQDRDRVIEFLSGAPEVVLSKIKNLSKKNKERWLRQLSQLGSMGYRMVGFGYKQFSVASFQRSVKIKREEVGDYKWLGLVVFEDPVRRGVAESLFQAKRAGIDIKVITGDYKETAWAVVRQAGLAMGEPDARVLLTGEEIARFSDDELERRIGDVILFAHQRVIKNAVITYVH